MRVRFNEVFEIINGAITPKTTVTIGGITMTPGVSFGGGVSFSGVELSKYIGKDLEIEKKEDGSIEIKGTYE